MASATTSPSTTTPAPAARKPEWAPRMWEGCDFFAWMKLLFRNRFAVHPSCWYIAVIVTCVSFMHTLLRLVQEAIYGRRIRKTALREPPIFILGHWRTGTTLLHELLILDPRHGYPTTYECLDPNHFLLTEGFFTRWLRVPHAVAAAHGQHEGRLRSAAGRRVRPVHVGQPSPYLTIAFPNRPPQCQEYLDLEGVPAGKVRFHPVM